MSTNLKFITGLSGEAHVKPGMDAQWHSALSGKETFVYDYGEKFTLTVNQATSTMSIKDGIGQIQGRLFIIEESLIETISYPNVPPEVGLTRIDTVLLHWGTSTRIINGETVTINTCEFEYKKNPLANGQPEAFAETDLNLGDTDAYYPMWHVTWNENGIQEVEEIFAVVDKTIEENTENNYIIIGNFAMCWGNTDVQAIPASPNGSVAVEVNFPITFANVPFVVPFVSAGFGGGRGVVAYADPSLQTTTKGNIRLNNIVGNAITGATNGVGWVAIGSIAG